MIGRPIVSCTTLVLGLSLAGTTAALAQSAPIEEVRAGVLAHSVEPSNAESGADLNVEALFRRSTPSSGDGSLLAQALRPRVHLGASVNTIGETSQLYAGLTWDAKLMPGLRLELTLGGALHNGPAGDGFPDSYGCALNFRESASLGYAINDTWTVYGTVAHMSNANLCDQNSGITSAGMRLGYKLK